MPKEKIHGDNPGTQPFEVVVGWQRDCDMQVGIQVVDPRTSDDPDTLAKVLYGPNDGAKSMIGGRLRKALESQGIEVGPVDNTWLGAQSLDAIESELVSQTSIWWTPTRYGVNSLIRLLRKARDAAFGADA